MNINHTLKIVSPHVETFNNEIQFLHHGGAAFTVGLLVSAFLFTSRAFKNRINTEFYFIESSISSIE